jgi:hypothetical protein
MYTRKAHATREAPWLGVVGDDQPDAGLVHHHHDELRCVALRYFAQEERHRLGVHPRQYEAVQHAVVRTDSAESVEVLALQSRTDHWPCAVRRPTAPRCAQQAEAAFVLEHQPHLTALLSLARDLLAYRTAQFF